MNYYSPLRYPGGKGKLSKIFKQLITENSLCDGIYIEPYAGGASVALSLLINEYVSKIIINDLDVSIYLFWDSVLNNTEELCRFIQDTPVNIDCWDRQKFIQNNKEKFDNIDIAFSTFFLNRTNYSGILKGGIIGGRNQTGNWKIDARYNKENLIDRIKKIALYKNRIELRNDDAIVFLKKMKRRKENKTIIYLDPPYFIKGKDLYLNYYNEKDHTDIADMMKELNHKWVITYDKVPFIKNAYKKFRQIEYCINYSTAGATIGDEIFVFSDNILIPKYLLRNKHNYKIADSISTSDSPGPIHV